ncbi:MAG: ABC transporter ATP-binding protein [Christensenellales bacterium]|jgi:ATP-binding cassette subfamily B protein
MKHLLVIAKKFRGLIALYILMGALCAFLSSFGASYFRTVIDRFTGGTLTLRAIAVYGAILILQCVLSYAQEYPGRKLENSISLGIRTQALRKVATIDYLSYVKLGTGAIIQRIETGASAGTGILFGYAVRLASELIPSMLFSLIFVLAINRAIMAGVLAGYVVVFIVTNLLLKVLYRIKERILVNEEWFNRLIVRGFMEMVVFRVHRRFAHEIRKAETASGEIVAARVKMKLIHEAFFTAFAVLVSILKIGIIAYGWVSRALTIGEIVALVALLDNAYTPVAIFNVLYVDYKLDRVAFARYARFLDAPDDAQLLSGGEMRGAGGALSLQDVHVRYGARAVLSGLDLHIEGGKSVAIVGESGSGKSTVAKLLAGLLHPARGRILVGGADLSRIRLDHYYAHIAYLPQEPAVFDGSLRENLVFDDAADDESVANALDAVGLSPLLAKLEQGIDTQLGERGVTLSGGERQQLALARLWFSRAQIVLLDEATSAIDNRTETTVMRHVMRRLAGKTVVAVAHRLDSIKDFDEIIVMQSGRIVERGSFQMLLESRGHFWALYERRAKERA